MRYSELPDRLKQRVFGNVIEHGDGSISVEGHVDWNSYKLVEIPIKFRHVTEYFWCPFNELTSLENAPDYIGGDFLCYRNKLTSLDGLGEVRGKIVCDHNLVPASKLLVDYRQKRARKELAEESLAIERILS